MNTLIKEENAYTSARERIELYRKQQRKKKMRIQKLMGIILTVSNIICAYIALDFTAAAVTVPLGLFLICSKELVIQI